MVESKHQWKAWLYLLPAIVLLLVFTVWPIINTIYMAFHNNYNAMSALNGATFSIGVENFKSVVKAHLFVTCLKNTLLLCVLTVPISTILALLIAVALNSIKPLQKTLQTIFFLPYVTNSIAIGMVFAAMFNIIGPTSDLYVSQYGVYARPNLKEERDMAEFEKVDLGGDKYYFVAKQDGKLYYISNNTMKNDTCSLVAAYERGSVKKKVINKSNITFVKSEDGGYKLAAESGKSTAYLGYLYGENSSGKDITDNKLKTGTSVLLTDEAASSPTVYEEAVEGTNRYKLYFKQTNSKGEEYKEYMCINKVSTISSVGIINNIIEFFGGSRINWINIGSSYAANLFVMVVYIVWNALPFKILILLGGLQSINKQYYDAAKIDGTRKSRVLWRITVPLLSPMLAYVIITGFIGGFKEYTSIVGIFGDTMGPADKKDRLQTMVGYIYRVLPESEYGEASAAALILFAIIFAVTMVNLYVSKKKVHY